MGSFDYQNFDIIFAPTENKDEYSAEVHDIEVGDGNATFTLKEIIGNDILSETEENTNGVNPVSRRFKIISPKDNDEYLEFNNPFDMKEGKIVGGNFFRSVFKDTLSETFIKKLEKSNQNNFNLRLRLNLTRVPELAVLPWEYLYNPRKNSFYAQSGSTPIIRYLNQDAGIQDLGVEGTVRILVLTSSPLDAEPLNVEAEWEKLQNVLKPLSDQNRISLTHLEKATFKDLQNILEDNVTTPFHIFHFIGHGGFEDEQGILLFEDDTKNKIIKTGEQLARLLNGQGIRLAVINACDGAISARSNSYAGIAQTLCFEANIPAVVAMRFEIKDETAIIFAEKLYDTLLNKRFPLEAALTASRKTVLNDDNLSNEWATPVLYMRSNNGRILKDAPVIKSVETVEENNFSRLPELKEHYDSVFEALRDGTLVIFVGLDANLFGRTSDPQNWDEEKGLPDTKELARYLSKRFKYAGDDLPDLGRIAQFSVANGDTSDLLKEVARILNSKNNKPTLLHSTIAQLAAKILKEINKEEKSEFLRSEEDFILKRFIVVTTGYDNLFEQAFKETVIDFHVLSYTAKRHKFFHIEYKKGEIVKDESGERKKDGKFIEIPNEYKGLKNDSNPIILKLPGTIEDIDQLPFAITEDDYYDFPSYEELKNPLPPEVSGKLKQSKHLYLGYSPCSWNMRSLLYRIWESQQTVNKSWAVLNNSNQVLSKLEKMDEIFWRKCGVEPLEVSLKDYIEGLYATATGQ